MQNKQHAEAKIKSKNTNILSFSKNLTKNLPSWMSISQFSPDMKKELPFLQNGFQEFSLFLFSLSLREFSREEM